jgi:hypothetical protein
MIARDIISAKHRPSLPIFTHNQIVSKRDRSSRNRHRLPGRFIVATSARREEYAGFPACLCGRGRLQDMANR